MKKITFLLLSLIGFTAHAESTTIFQCKTTNNKIVSVKLINNVVSYKFGKNLNNPELAFSVPKKMTSTYQWSGTGSSIYYDVEVPNGKTIYTVYSSLDRMTEEHPTESGVTVTNKNQQIATILCDENKEPYINNLVDVNLPSKN